MSILLTGGAGYIGTHTCVEMLNAGYDIIVVDNFSNSSERALDNVKEITGRDFLVYNFDLNDIAFERVFRENNIKAVIHFAGYKAVGESIRSPLSYYYNNIIGTLNLCRLMQQYCVKKIVFSSSATVYNVSDNRAIEETAPLKATNPYGQSKLIIEQILHDLYVSDQEWGISILRYFNPIGAHESGRIGESPKSTPNNIMPYLSQVAIGKLPELKVFGDDYPTPDGTGIRDYIHVMDLAEGHIKALSKIINSKGVATYNLGTGTGYSVMELIDAFEKVTGRKIPYVVTERRSGDIASCYANPSKAYKELAWEPTRGLEKMCEDAWRWQLLNPNGYL